MPAFLTPIRWLFLILSLTIAIPLQAAEEDSRLWQTVVAEGNFNQDIRWYAELQARWKDDIQNFDQAFFRPAINYAVSDKATIWLGYVYADTKTARGHTYEDRWWQQFQYVSKYDDITLLSRTRVEQRHLDSGDKTSHRIRQQVRASWPIQGRTDLSYLVWDEVLWNLNDTRWAGESGFNQNRLFAGVLWKYTNSSRLEIGYLNQYVNGTNGALDLSNHVLSSTFFIGF